MLIIFIGVFLMIIGSLAQTKQFKSNTKMVLGGFIGPIPFGFFNDKPMFYVLIGLISFVLVSWFILRIIGIS